MKWFGRKSMAPAAGFALPAWLTSGEDRAGFARGYEAQLGEVFRRNPVGLRAVRLVSDAVGGLTVEALEGPDEAARLAGSSGLMERIALGLLLNGNAYLGSIGVELAGLSVEAGLEPMFQVGEPWWWVQSDGAICCYDEAAKAALGGSPVAIPDVRGTLNPPQLALLDQAGELLAQSTASIVAAVKAAVPATRSHLLVYLPTLLDPRAPEVRRANLPTGWALPAFDRLQLEDYEWVVEAFGIELIEAEGGLKGVQPASAVEIGQFELGCSIDDRRVPNVETSRSSSSKLPGEVSIRYYDATRDYQAGQARTVGTADGARCIAMELPAVLAASDAKAMAERFLARSWSGGSKVRLRLPPFRMDLRPGAIVRLPGSRRCWTIRSIEIEGLAVSVEAEELVAPPVPAAADPGIALSGPDLPIGRTILSLLELPAPGSGESVELLVTAACAGAWKPAPVELDLGGAPLPPVAIVRPSRMGQAETVLRHGGSSLLDLRGSVVIRLADPGSHLFHADDAAMMAGANLAVLGRELIQFGRADELEPGLYRLSRLLRGRRGTEWAASGHGAGDDFVLVEEACAVPVNLPASSIGASLKATARGVADKPPLPFAQRLLTGESLRPPSPCHLTARSLPEGLRIEWVGRSASAWHWIDGEIAPAQHGYRLRLSGPAGDRLLAANEDWIQCDWPLVPAAPADELNISVVAVGPLASSHPATASIVL